MAPQTPQPSRSETLVGVLALLVVVGVGVGVVMAQGQFDPAPFRAATSAALTSEGERSAAAPVSGLSLPQGVQADGAPQAFSTETLHHKINGKADLYLSAGFESLRCQRVRSDDDGRVELCIYTMKSADAAFSVWSSQRRDGADKVALTRHAYSTANAAYAAMDRRYVELASVASTAASARLRLALLAALAGETAGSGEGGRAGAYPSSTGAETGEVEATAGDRLKGEGVSDLQLLALPCVRPETIKLIAESAFGMAEFDRVIVAPCGEGDEAPRLFVSRRKDTAGAGELASQFVAFLLENGAEEAPDREGIRLLSLFGAGEAIFAYGPLVAGVHEAVDLASAATLATQLRTHLLRGTP